MKRQKIFDYAKKVYGTVPEYLWKQYPGYAILRMKGTDKWYAAIMNVSRDKLGIEVDGEVKILNVKCDPEMAGSQLIQSDTLVRVTKYAYHIKGVCYYIKPELHQV